MAKRARPQPRRRAGRGRALFWLAMGVSALLFGAAVFGRDGLLAVLVNRERLAGLREEIGALDGENRRLRAEILSLRNDLRAIERIAREDLGLVKPGETVYEFLPRTQGEGARPPGAPARGAAPAKGDAPRGGGGASAPPAAPRSP